jgi:pilus assembly protein CpaE
VLGFISAKGGCGASMVASHIAVDITEQSHLETLLVDFDLEGGIVSFLMKAQSRYSILDAVNNIRRLDMSFWKALVNNGRPGLEVISAPTASAPLHQIYRDPEDYRTILRFARANYDWTIADFGHGLGYLLLSVLEELDNLYLVTTLDVPALHQTKHVITGVLERGLPAHRLQVILNRFPKRAEVTIEEVESIIGQPVYATLPDDPQEVSDALAEGKLVPADSLLGGHISRVVGKIAGFEMKKKKKFSLF